MSKSFSGAVSWSTAAPASSVARHSERPSPAGVSGLSRRVIVGLRIRVLQGVAGAPALPATGRGGGLGVSHLAARRPDPCGRVAAGHGLGTAPDAAPRAGAGAGR